MIRGLARLVAAGAMAGLATAAWAEPVQVTLYPGLARVLERAEATLEPEGQAGRAVIELPRGADPATLRVVAGSGRVRETRLRSAPRLPSGEAKDLRERVRLAEAERDAVHSKVLTLEARIDFWRSQGRPERADPAALQALAQVAAEAVAGLYRDRLAVETALKEADKRLAELRQRLEQISGQGEESWEATVVVEDAAGRALPLEWSYDLPECGWSPLYRLEGLPRERKIRLGFEAEVWQNSGRDWREVDLILATARPSAAQTPPAWRPWVVGPRPEFAPLAAPAPAADPVMRKEITTRTLAAPAEPVREERATFDLWRLGVRSVPAGERARLPVTAETWEAEFSCLLRPAVSRQAFVRAAVNRRESADLPPGPALVEYDGSYVGRRDFRLTPGDRTVFFGADPQISAAARVLDRQSGERGFFGKEQTLTWNWEYAVKNDHDRAVTVRLEAPAPRAGDERVKLDVNFEPQPQKEAVGQGAEETALFVWTFEVAPKSEKTVRYGVTAKAPADMALDPGR